MTALQQLSRKTSKKKEDDENAPKGDWGGWVSFFLFGELNPGRKDKLP